MLLYARYWTNFRYSNSSKIIGFIHYIFSTQKQSFMYKIIEKIGFILFIIGFLLMLIEKFVDDGFFNIVIEQWQIFFWTGMALWSIGYSQRKR